MSWLLNEAAFSLRALGRLEEALAPMHAGAEMAAQRKDWMNAAIAYATRGGGRKAVSVGGAVGEQRAGHGIGDSPAGVVLVKGALQRAHEHVALGPIVENDTKAGIAVAIVLSKRFADLRD